MALPEFPDVNFWDYMFEHTPRALRWVFGILTIGIFTMLGILYRWNKEDMRRIEGRIDHIDSRIDQLITMTARKGDE